jgi:hypothetical protein
LTGVHETFEISVTPALPQRIQRPSLKGNKRNTDERPPEQAHSGFRG